MASVPAIDNPNRLSERLDALEAFVREQDSALHHVFATVQSISRGEAQQDDHADRTPMRDRVWACANCAARLGLYNERTEEMRVRYKDFVVYIKPGVGGFLKVPCRRCGEENILHDTAGPS
jgi:hypothetical protein